MHYLLKGRGQYSQSPVQERFLHSVLSKRSPPVQGTCVPRDKGVPSCKIMYFALRRKG